MALSPFGLLTLAFAAIQRPTPPEDVLRRCLDHRLAANVDAIVEKPYRTGETMTIHVVYDTAGRRRTEILAPASIQGRIFVDDGETWTTYSPQSRVLKVHAAPPDENLDMRMHLVQRNYRVEFDGKTTIAGRPALVIVATPRDPALRTQRFYVDATNSTPLKAESVDGIGGVTVQFAVRRIGFPGRLAANAFAPPNADGARRETGRSPLPIHDLDAAERQFGFRPAMPHHLPMGFRPLTMDVMDRDGESPIGSRLSDGLAMVFVFQSRVGGPPPPARPGDGPRVAQEVGDVRVEVRSEDVPLVVRERILAAYVRILSYGSKPTGP